MYSYYLPKYNLRKAIPSSFTIDLEGSNSGMIDYELNITVEKVATTTASNIRLHVVVTESNIMQSWQGQSELHHVERLMVPNQNGTVMDFSDGDIIEETVNFTMNTAWVNENCEVVVFLQNASNKEVLQAVKANLSDFGTSNVNDAALMNLVVPQLICSNTVAPKVKIANYGLDNLTSLDIIYSVNGESPVTYAWTGDLNTYESEIVELDPYSFTLAEQNSFTLDCENPNGQEDEFPSNNTKDVDMEQAPNVASPVSLALKLDDNPGEVTWEVVDSEGLVVYSGGPYSNPGQFIVQQFTLEQADCYAFKIYDEGGDGLTGTGSYKLAHEGSTIFAEGKDYGFEDQVQFQIGITAIDLPSAHARFDVYPNPVSGHATIAFSMENSGTVQLNVFNSLGEMVHQTGRMYYAGGDHQITVAGETLEPGLYYFRLEAGQSNYTKKVIVK